MFQLLTYNNSKHEKPFLTPKVLIFFVELLYSYFCILSFYPKPSGAIVFLLSPLPPIIPHIAYNFISATSRYTSGSSCSLTLSFIEFARFYFGFLCIFSGFCSILFGATLLGLFNLYKKWNFRVGV